MLYSSSQSKSRVYNLVPCSVVNNDATFFMQGSDFILCRQPANSELGIRGYPGTSVCWRDVILTTLPCRPGFSQGIVSWLSKFDATVAPGCMNTTTVLAHNPVAFWALYRLRRPSWRLELSLALPAHAVTEPNFSVYLQLRPCYSAALIVNVRSAQVISPLTHQRYHKRWPSKSKSPIREHRSLKDTSETSTDKTSYTSTVNREANPVRFLLPSLPH